MKILLMNPNSNAATTNEICAIAGPYLSGTPIGWTAAQGPKLITTPEALSLAARGVEQATLPAPFDAVIVAAFGDPGAEALARRLPCPVIGIGGAAARAASADGAAFAVATTTPFLSASITAAMMRHGARGRYIGTFTSSTDPLRLMSDDDTLDAVLLEQIQLAAECGAQRVVIGGGPLGRAAQRLVSASPVPLINPIIAACEALRDCLNEGATDVL